jgi:hypothetical protein
VVNDWMNDEIFRKTEKYKRNLILQDVAKPGTIINSIFSRPNTEASYGL